MPSRRLALLFTLILVVVPALAGCNTRDWLDERGTVQIHLRAVNPTESPEQGYRTALNEFQTLKVSVHGVTIARENEASPRHYAFDPPEVVDLVALHKRNGSVPLVEDKFSLRPIAQVTIVLSVLEAVDATGRSLPECVPRQPVESRPCVSRPATGAYRHSEIPFSVPRGGTVTFGFAMEVLFSPSVNEYVLYRDPAQATIVNS